MSRLTNPVTLTDFFYYWDPLIIFSQLFHVFFWGQRSKLCEYRLATHILSPTHTHTLNSHVFIYTYVCIIVYMYLFCLICIHMYTHVYMFIPMLYLYAHMCADIYVFVCTYVCRYIYVCTHMCTPRTSRRPRWFAVIGTCPLCCNLRRAAARLTFCCESIGWSALDNGILRLTTWFKESFAYVNLTHFIYIRKLERCCLCCQRVAPQPGRPMDMSLSEQIDIHTSKWREPGSGC